MFHTHIVSEEPGIASFIRHGIIGEGGQESQVMRAEKKESVRLGRDKQTMFNSLDIILKVTVNHCKVRVEHGIIIFDLPKNFLVGV